jgi:hypothetical protein
MAGRRDEGALTVKSRWQLLSVSRNECKEQASTANSDSIWVTEDPRYLAARGMTDELQTQVYSPYRLEGLQLRMLERGDNKDVCSCIAGWCRAR